jgi:DNA-binding response OmpR family regulator
LRENSYDLAILDVMLPSLSGFNILRQARQRGILTPAIMLTARAEEIDKVLGLELGADDYMTKPFSLRELTARVAALLRRHGPRGETQGPTIGPLQDADDNVLRVLDCEVDLQRQLVRVGGASCALSPREFELLCCLLRGSGRVLTREWLLQQVWGRDYDGEDRAVDTCVLRLRERLGRDSEVVRAIEAVRGVGYRLHPSGR